MPKKQRPNEYHRLLEKKRAEIEQELAVALRDREKFAAITAPDVVDEATLTTEREFAIANVDRLTKVLRQVKGALERMQDGTYGTCMRCEEKISPARLKAVPWAEYCTPCQEAVDEERAAAPEDEEGGGARYAA